MAGTSGMTPELDVLTDESINASGPDSEQEIHPEPTLVPQPEIELVPQPQLEQEIHTQGPEPAQEPDPQEEVGPQEPVPQPGPEHEPDQLNHPLPDLLNNERRRDFIDICVPLFQASTKGDWDAALRILQNSDKDNKYLVRCSITDNYETALHVAASAQRTSFVQNLVGKMQNEDLLYQNINGNTALCLTAITGNVKIARIMVELNRGLLTICNNSRMTPLYLAALYGKRDMVSYLYSEMKRFGILVPAQNIKWVFTKCVETDLFDIALKIFIEHPECAQSLDVQSALGSLARKPYAFHETRQHTMRGNINSINCSRPRPVAPNESEALKLLREVLKSVEERSKDEINTILRGPRAMTLIAQRQVATYPSRVLFVAAEMGNTNFIVELIRKFPDLLWKVNDNGLSIFHIAVSRRHLDIYNLLYEIGSIKDSIAAHRDKDGNNMLHLVGKMRDKNQSQYVPGAAFRIQRELLWYKEVESMVPPTYRERKNNSGQTPHEIFTDTNMDLISESEKWMRGTASKCMLVATLVATIVFGVAYTIPGGIDPDSRDDIPFLVFVVLDAISLIFSSTSILVFLSILTSRYTEEDLIESLPKKLMVGLSMLFFSILTMMIAFSVSFYVTYRGKLIILAGCISLLAPRFYLG